MSKGKIKLISSGVRQVLKSSGARAACFDCAHSVAKRAEGNYEVIARNYRERSGAMVRPADSETAKKNAEDNVLLKGLH